MIKATIDLQYRDTEKYQKWYIIFYCLSYMLPIFGFTFFFDSGTFEFYETLKNMVALYSLGFAFETYFSTN
jgi:hypothetical protein